jgi:ABC-type xylose transport system substrate-binding protein
MAVQLAPIFRALAPYIAEIARTAIPAFTSKPALTKTDPVIAKQIEELQTAVTHNAESIHVLAEKLQVAIQNIERAAQEAQKQVATYKLILFCSLCFSVVSLATCIYILMK